MEWDYESRLPDGVAENLGYYVYLYVDPRTGDPFYVGKGVGERVLAHFGDVKDSEKTKVIAELRRAGMSPRLEILAHGLKDEETAFRIEAAVIDVLGLGALTNQVSGWRSLQMGRLSLDDLVGFYAAKPTDIAHPALIIRINQLFRREMSEIELYEATRGVWKLGARRENVQYALATFDGLVREVYEVHRWYPARTLPYQTRDLSARDVTGRWEFSGVVAPESIRSRYLHKSVRHYLKAGNQSPTVYVGVPEST